MHDLLRSLSADYRCAEKGGARPLKLETEAKGKGRHGIEVSRPVTLLNDSGLLCDGQLEGTQRERSSAVSLISSVAAVHEVWESIKAFWNSAGLAGVKFPKPSFKRIATGLSVQAGVTMTSGKLSPFTSRDMICNPPLGAVMPTICPAPPLR